MEKEAKDALNFLIGAANTVKTESEKFLGDIETKLNELKEKGAQDTSEVSMNMRKYTEEAFREIEKILADAKTRFDEVKAKAETILPKQQ
jgi:hypothetical protein